MLAVLKRGEVRRVSAVSLLDEEFGFRSWESGVDGVGGPP